jgi:hypothetical protein
MLSFSKPSRGPEDSALLIFSGIFHGLGQKKETIGLVAKGGGGIRVAPFPAEPGGSGCTCPDEESVYLHRAPGALNVMHSDMHRGIIIWRSLRAFFMRDSE